mgnify:CR=1 FL=1
MTLIILPRQLDEKPYRLRCRFLIERQPTARRLDLEKVRVAERFVADMRKQGWRHDARYDFRLRGPLPPVELTTLHPKPALTAAQMLTGVLAGQGFRDESPVEAVAAGQIPTAEAWEYEIAGVFTRRQILTEYADLHEEIR